MGNEDYTLERNKTRRHARGTDAARGGERVRHQFRWMRRLGVVRARDATLRRRIQMSQLNTKRRQPDGIVGAGTDASDDTMRRRLRAASRAAGSATQAAVSSPQSAGQKIRQQRPAAVQRERRAPRVTATRRVTSVTLNTAFSGVQFGERQ